MRIAIVGSHGTGKTTLLNEYKTDLHKITEISRDLIRNTGVKPQDMTQEEKIDFQKKLYEKQKQEEELHSDFISDRSVYDILAYTYDASIETHKQMLIDVIDNHYGYDHVFYTPIEFEIEDDGVRYQDLDFQKYIDSKIREIIDFLSVDYTTLSGDIEDRLKKMQETIL